MPERLSRHASELCAKTSNSRLYRSESTGPKTFPKYMFVLMRPLGRGPFSLTVRNLFCRH